MFKEFAKLVLATTKVFTAGNSQAVRLPKAFRTDVSEMWITKNEVTCKITLKLKDDDKRQRELNELLQIIKESPFAEDFIPPHDDAEAPDPFAELASAKDAKT